MNKGSKKMLKMGEVRLQSDSIRTCPNTLRKIQLIPWDFKRIKGVEAASSIVVDHGDKDLNVYVLLFIQE